MGDIYPKRYLGIRWSILFGSYTGVERIAVDQSQRMVQKYLPYVIEVLKATQDQMSTEGYMILIGTPDDNCLIRDLLADKSLKIEDHPQGYLLACLDSPWNKGARILLVTANNEKGVLFATQNLGKLLSTLVATRNLTSPEGQPDLRKSFDTLPDFKINDFPRIETRGIWTWGYVIRDYRRFIDHMVLLRMNALIIWNDIPPINSSQIIEYAHTRGISIIFGFHWGWGLPNLSLANAKDRQEIKKIVVREYQEHYQNLDLDGIYFQTLTEHSTVEEHGISTARAACFLVNDISFTLLGLKPELNIYFGLHATSIQEHFTDLELLDPRVTIIWEDAGSIPYAYDLGNDSQISTDTTLAYSKKLASFRPKTPFALVPKGWTCLRWEDEFEHHDSFILGEQEPGIIHQKLRERESQWNRVNSLWFKKFPIASRFYRELIKKSQMGMFVTGLIEDGGFEDAIQPSVSLFAETLWNPQIPDEMLLQEALNPYYKNG